MGIAVNLVTYLIGTMHLPSSMSANIVTDFMGTSFLLCLLGGFLADSFLGRYKTIAIFAAIQVLVSCIRSSVQCCIHLFFCNVPHLWLPASWLQSLHVTRCFFIFEALSVSKRLPCFMAMITMVIQGTGGLALSTKLPQLRPPPCGSSTTATGEYCTKANGFQMGILYLALYVIAIGTGGLKSSVSGFGTDQFDEKDEKEKAQMAYFFNRFFLFISIGTLTAVTVLVYIQDEVGRSWAYGICSVSMFLAIIVFLYGTKRYRYKKSIGSPIVHICQVIVAATRKRNMDHSIFNAASLYEDSPEASRIDRTDQFRYAVLSSISQKLFVY